MTPGYPVLSVGVGLDSALASPVALFPTVSVQSPLLQPRHSDGIVAVNPSTRFHDMTKVDRDPFAQDRRVRDYLVPSRIATASLFLGRGVSVSGVFIEVESTDSGVDGPGGGDPPSRNGNGIIKRFDQSETLESFLGGKTSQTFYLGIDPEDLGFEAYSGSTVPEHCTVKVELSKRGRLTFYVHGNGNGRARNVWIPLRPSLWNGRQVLARHVLDGMISITRSILVGEELPWLRPKLPDTYIRRVAAVYKLYQTYKDYGNLDYFYEMMRLGEQQDDIIPYYYSSRTREREDVLHFVERLYATMGLSQFILVIRDDNSLAAYSDMTIQPSRGEWAFSIRSVSPGIFSVDRRTLSGVWEELHPPIHRDADEDPLGTQVVDQLLGDAEFVRVVLRDEMDNPVTRGIFDSLLTLSSRAAESRELSTLIDSHATIFVAGYPEFVELLFDYFCSSLYITDWLPHVPHFSLDDPVRRFLTALTLINEQYFGDLIQASSSDSRLGTFGWYYLRYALRMYVAERARRYFTISVFPYLQLRRGLTWADCLNSVSTYLFHALTSHGGREALMMEMRTAPVNAIFRLATRYGEEARFYPGGEAREKFIAMAQSVSSEIPYPEAQGDGVES